MWKKYRILYQIHHCKTVNDLNETLIQHFGEYQTATWWRELAQYQHLFYVQMYQNVYDTDHHKVPCKQIKHLMKPIIKDKLRKDEYQWQTQKLN